MAINDLVVVVPGILGSRLVRPNGDRTDVLWDLRLKSLPGTLALLARRGFDPPDPADGVIADRLLNEPAWLPDFFGVDGYTEMVKLLQARLPHGQVVAFPYDWRYSNAVSAEKLDRWVRPLLTAWQSGPGDASSRLVLVCHSMGGLVARYFCEQLGGAALTRRVITFGTPHRGAAKALCALSGSMKIGFVLGLRPIVEHWPSVWEMLPQYPCVRMGTGPLARLHESGLELAEDPRYAAARAFQLAIREPAEERVRTGGVGYDQLVFFGRVQTTVQYAEVHGDGMIRPIVPGTGGVPDRGGDGTVPSFAAVPIEWDTTEGALPLLDKHTALATRAAALEHLLNRLDPDQVGADKNPMPGRVPDVLDGLDTATPAPDLGPTDLVAEGFTLDVPAVVGVDDEVVVTIIHPDRVRMPLTVFDHERNVASYNEARAVGEIGSRTVLTANVGRLAAGVYTVGTLDEPRVADRVLVWSEAAAELSLAQRERATSARC